MRYTFGASARRTFLSVVALVVSAAVWVVVAPPTTANAGPTGPVASSAGADLRPARMSRTVKTKRWRRCSHLSPWNGVDYGPFRGATVIKARKMSCRRAAHLLRRTTVDEQGVISLHRWRCFPTDHYSYGGTTTVCKRKVGGRVRKMRVILWH